MRLSAFTDFSLRVLIYAAIKDDLFQLDEVSAAYGISRHHLSKVVHRLGRLGYLETQRGRGGGIRLAKRPEAIRLGALVRLSEDAAPLVECFDARTNTCRISGTCRLKGMLAVAMNAFYASLDRHTLHDIVGGVDSSRLHRVLMPAFAREAVGSGKEDAGDAPRSLKRGATRN